MRVAPKVELDATAERQLRALARRGRPSCGSAVLACDDDGEGHVVGRGAPWALPGAIARLD